MSDLKIFFFNWNILFIYMQEDKDEITSVETYFQNNHMDKLNIYFVYILFH